MNLNNKSIAKINFHPIGIKLIALLITITLFVLAGCASTGDSDEDDVTIGWSAQKLYDQAKEELEAGDYELAIEYFEKLEARYPFGKYAQQAQLETIYTYFLFDEPDSAIAAADRFIKLHPTHKNVVYAYYMRGVASFHKKDSPFDMVVYQDPAERDSNSSRNSFNYFSELVKKFPNSKYAPDSIKRMKFQRNLLAKHELQVASYYLKRGAYVAAVNRTKYVIENYQQTPSIPGALKLLTKAYELLNMDDLAKDAQRVLELNFPNLKQKDIKVNI